MKPAVALTILGGAREIGANSYHLELGSTGILLDAGIHPKLEGEAALPDFDAVRGEVDAILISHAHLDHVGALPVALQRFPRARVYMTRPTSLLAIRMLRNAVAVARSRARAAGAEARPLFDHDHVEWVAQVVCTRAPGREFSIAPVGGAPTRMTFFPAGHILGAVGVLIEYAGRRIFYTGDTCASGQFICAPASYPAGPVDLLLLDSTHGADPEPDLGRDRRAFGRAKRELAGFIREVAGRGGSVLIPVFALGRTQEVLGVLYDLVRRDKIPRLPIYISGLAHAIGRIYDATRHDSVRRHAGVCLEELAYTVFDLARADDPALLEQPCILAVSSGMVHANTASNAVAARLVQDPRHGVAFVGYLDPASPGHRLSRTLPGGSVDLGGGPLTLAASVRSFDFSAHSRASRLMELVREIRPKRVVLVHGDSDAVERLKRSLSEAKVRVDVAEAGQRVEL